MDRGESEEILAERGTRYTLKILTSNIFIISQNDGLNITQKRARSFPNPYDIQGL